MNFIARVLSNELLCRIVLYSTTDHTKQLGVAQHLLKNLIVGIFHGFTYLPLVLLLEVLAMRPVSCIGNRPEGCYN